MKKRRVSGSGRWARSTSKTKRKHSISNRSSGGLAYNDDEAEKRRLSENEIKHQEKENVRLSHDDYMQILNKTLALSQAGKINQKNAWGLELNEHLDVVVNESAEGDATNFQQASCTLDASVKIYSVRVDSVHTQTFKVLGGLTRTNKSNDEDEDNETKEGNQRKKRTNASKGSMLASSVDSLNAKEKDFQGSMVGAGVFNILRNSASDLFLETLSAGKMCNMHWDSHVEDDENDETYKSSDFEGFLPQSSDFVDNTPVCDELTDLKDLWEQTKKRRRLKEESKDIHSADDLCDDDDVSFYFNPEATRLSGSCEDFLSAFSDDDMGDGEIQGMNQPVYDWGDDDASDMEEKMQSQHIVKILKSLKVGNRDEYSWSNLDSSKDWTSNSFWAFSKKSAKQKRAGDKLKKKPKKKKKLTFIDFFSPVADEKELAPPARSQNLLTKSAIKKMKANKKKLIMEPKADVVDEELLLHLFLKRSDHVISQSGDGIFAEKTITGMSLPPLEDVGNFVGDDDGFDDGGFDDFGGAIDYSADPYSESTLELISKPSLASKLDINFSRTAKKVDVRALKHVMWNTVETAMDEEEVKKESIEEDSLREDFHHSDTFQSTIDSVSTELPSGMAKNASVPFYFICLLHLANEHNLHFEPMEANLGDFRISKCQD